jgi:hypothetical protein
MDLKFRQEEVGPENPLYLEMGSYGGYQLGPRMPVLDGLTAPEYAYMKKWLHDHYARTKKFLDGGELWECDGSKTSILERECPGKAVMVYSGMLNELRSHFQHV